jgi:hypothetical protein
VGSASQGGSGNSNILAGGAGGLQSGSPVKESSFLNRETSVDEVDDNEKENNVERANDSVSLPPAKEGIPIRK